MGQIEVLNLLKKHKHQWFTATQIEKLLKVSKVDASLEKLRKYSEIKFKDNPNRKRGYLYSY